MKRYLLIGVVGLLPLMSFAHGGRTDSAGCHREMSTRSRHCHEEGYTPPSRRPASVKAPTRYTPHEHDGGDWHTHDGPANVPGCRRHSPTVIRHCHQGVEVYAPPAPNRMELYTQPVVVAPPVEDPRVAYPRAMPPVDTRGRPDPEGARVIIVNAPPAVHVIEQRMVAPVVVQPVRQYAPRATRATRVKVKALPQDQHVFFFENCYQAQLAGRAPLTKGQDGYRSELDPDGDGVACPQ